MTDIDTILSIQSTALQSFSETQAVATLRRLLWAEVGRLKLPVTRVTSSLNTKIADGGIDASISGPVCPDSVLSEGPTSFQVKAGKSFAPWRRSDIEKELWGKRARTRAGLGTELGRRLERNDRFVLVTFGHDLIDTQRPEAIGLLVELLEGCGFKDLNIDVWGIEQILGLLRRYPSLSLEVANRNQLEFLTYDVWSRSANMSGEFRTGNTLDNLIGEIQATLREPCSRHIRITGEPGIGKTRLILEALRPEDLSNRVVYCPHAEYFRQSRLMRELMGSDVNFNAIVVLDDCSRGDRAEIWNYLSSYRDRLSLITLSHDPDAAQDESLHSIAVPTLSDELIEGILEGYSDERTRIHVHRWVSLCEGSPRVAHLIGRNLRINPDEVLAPLSTNNVWERFVVGPDDSNSQRVEQRWLVLRFVALFRRFGFQSPVDNEARAIAELVREADPNITWHRFREIICELQQRRIIQGLRTLRIVPRALHVWLWIQWWQTFGGCFNYAEFVSSLGGDLERWFAEMFVYAGASPESAIAAESLVRHNGAITGETITSATGAAFFGAVAEACPEAGLRFLERTFDGWADEHIRTFGGRRRIIWALERIVVWRRLFRRGAMLLLRLAENESETCSNNSTGVFISLFAPGPGDISMTEAPPNERLPVLRELVMNSEGQRLEIALRACESGLMTRGFFRAIGAEYQGLRRQPELWYPRSYEEYSEAYSGVWNLLVEAYDSYSGETRNSIAKILIGRSLPLLSNLRDSDAEWILAALDRLAEDTTNSRQLIGVCLDAQARWTTSVSASSLNRLSEIHERLVGTSLEAQIRRYVGMNLRRDWSGRNVSWSEGQEILRQRLMGLAEQCLAERSLLTRLLPWLCTSDAERAEIFGEQLSSLPGGMDWLSAVWDALESEGTNGDGALLVGFYRSLRQTNEQEWERNVSELIENTTRRQWVALIIRCSGDLTEWGAQRVIELVETGNLSILQLARWRWGDNFRLVDSGTFNRWLEALLAAEENGTNPLSLGLIASYLHWRNSEDLDLVLPLDLLDQVLRSTFLLLDVEDPASHDHDWSEVARFFAESQPNRGLDLFEFCLVNMFSGQNCRDVQHTPCNEILWNIFRTQTERCWELVRVRMEVSGTNRYQVMRWLRGGPLGFERNIYAGLLGEIPREELWSWVDESSDDRACLLAANVPQTLGGKEGALTRELLVRYGNLDSVRRSLFSNFGSTGWVGSSVTHFRNLRLSAEEWRDATTEPRILRWIDLYLEHLSWDIERSEINEERSNH